MQEDSQKHIAIGQWRTVMRFKNVPTGRCKSSRRQSAKTGVVAIEMKSNKTTPSRMRQVVARTQGTKLRRSSLTTPGKPQYLNNAMHASSHQSLWNAVLLCVLSTPLPHLRRRRSPRRSDPPYEARPPFHQPKKILDAERGCALRRERK